MFFGSKGRFCYFVLLSWGWVRRYGGDVGDGKFYFFLVVFGIYVSGLRYFYYF